MRRSFTAFAAFAFVASLAGTAGAMPMKDKAGKCRDNGKFVAASMCKAPMAMKCRDTKTKKFAKCGAAGTEAVPMKK